VFAEQRLHGWRGVLRPGRGEQLLGRRSSADEQARDLALVGPRSKAPRLDADIRQRPGHVAVGGHAAVDPAGHAVIAVAHRGQRPGDAAALLDGELVPERRAHRDIDDRFVDRDRGHAVHEAAEQHLPVAPAGPRARDLVDDLDEREVLAAEHPFDRRAVHRASPDAIQLAIWLGLDGDADRLPRWNDRSICGGQRSPGGDRTRRRRGPLDGDRNRLASRGVVAVVGRSGVRAIGRPPVARATRRRARRWRLEGVLGERR
jgi:hypothetical protein